MASNNGNNKPNQTAGKVVTPPVTEQTSETPATETTTTDTVKVAEQKSVETSSAAAVPVVAEVETSVADAEAPDETNEDSSQVTYLKAQLEAFRVAITKPGKDSADFKSAAEIAADFTRHVMKYPKVPVLDALLAWFEDNVNGAADSKVFMKGNNTLSQVEAQQVGYLYGLWIDLARRQVNPINSATVVNVLRKIEISNYYGRKVAGFRAAREAAAAAE